MAEKTIKEQVLEELVEYNDAYVHLAIGKTIDKILGEIENFKKGLKDKRGIVGYQVILELLNYLEKREKGEVR